VNVRRARPEDAPACGQICFEAFHKISTDHNFPPDVPAPEHGVGLLTRIFSHPGFYCVVADRMAASPAATASTNATPSRAWGRSPSIRKRRIAASAAKLMEAVLDRARERKFAGSPLVQAAFHSRSLSLYTTLGFDVREPLAVFQGPRHQEKLRGISRAASYIVRPRSVHQSCAARAWTPPTAASFADAIQQRTATVVERHGRITGYTSSLAFFGHSVAETNPDLQAIIAAADGFRRPGNPGAVAQLGTLPLVPWPNGLRVVQPMTLMSLGLYNEPRGAFLALGSVLKHELRGVRCSPRRLGVLGELPTSARGYPQNALLS